MFAQLRSLSRGSDLTRFSSLSLEARKIRGLRFLTLRSTRFQSMACQSRRSPDVTCAACCSQLFLPVAVSSHRPLGRWSGTRQYPFGWRHSALSGGLCVPRAFRRAGLRFLSSPVPAAGLARSCERVTGVCSRPQWGSHVPHRQEALGELASLRRERGTVSAGPQTPADPGSSKDGSTTFVPLCVTTLPARLRVRSTRFQFFLA